VGKVTKAVDALVGLVSPAAAVRRIHAREVLAAYSSYKAARDRSESTAPDVPASQDEQELSLYDLQRESQHLVNSSGLAEAAIKTNVNGIVGSGLRLGVKINREQTGLSDSKADKLERDIEFHWKIFCDEVDAQEQFEFDALLALATRVEMVQGDVFFEVFRPKRFDGLFSTRLKMIEASRCENPLHLSDSDVLSCGVQFEEKTLRRTGYWFTYEEKNQQKWVKVPPRFRDGTPRIIHHYEPRRPGQMRGFPYLSVVLKEFAKLDQYQGAELDSAVVNTLFTAFVKNASRPLFDGDIDQSVPKHLQKKGKKTPVEMGSANVVYLGKNEDVEFADPKRPNPNYGPFMDNSLSFICSALGVPSEVVLNSFKDSFSASRAANMQAYRYFKARRKLLISSVLKKVFALFIQETVVRRLIDYPDQLLSLHYSRFLAAIEAEFTGDGMLILDPVKEIKAAKERLDLGLTTRQEEAAMLTGTDWNNKYPRIAAEKALIQKLNSEVA
jgi:lambda family phage portal protein